MDLQRLKALIDLVVQSRVSELEISENGEHVRICKAVNGTPPIATAPRASDASYRPAAPPKAQAAQGHPGADGHVVAATMFGLFHRAPSPEASPFVSVGQAVAAGEKLGLIEAMKTFNVVEADRAGVVTAVLAENGQEVEPGQPLFRIG